MLSNFDPATNSMIMAKSGSLYNRTLVNPDYKDFGAAHRPGLQHRPEDGGARRLRHQLRAPQSPGQRRRAGHQRAAGRVSARSISRIPAGRRAARRLPDHAQQASRPGLASPANFNPVHRQRRLHSQGYALAVRADLVPLRAAGAHEGHRGRSGLQRQPQLAAADHRRLQPGAAQSARARRWAFSRAGPIRASARSPGWIRPGIQTTTASRRAWSIASRAGLYFLNSFTWSKALGDSEQALEYAPRLLRGQSAEHLQPGSGARAVQLRREVHQRHQRGVPASLRQRPQVRLAAGTPVVDARRWAAGN